MTRTAKYVGLDDGYFDNINQEPNAYWLGFLLADGNVCKSVVTLALSSRDTRHVEAFASAVGLARETVKVYTTNKGYGAARLSLHSKHMADCLRQLECFDRKSTVHGFPGVPHQVHRHLIRGYFDGNGSVHSYKCIAKSGHLVSPRWSVSVVGPEAFIETSAALVREATGCVATCRKTKSVWEMRLSAIDDMRRFEEYIYEGASVFLERKRAVFRDMGARTSLRSLACSVDGCDRQTYSTGVCQLHYKQSVGVRSKKCLFTLEQEAQIFERRTNGEKLRVLAEDFGCTTTSIYDVCRRESKRRQSSC